MRSGKLFLLPLCVAFSSSLAISAQENQVRAVRISYVQGTVKLVDASGVEFDQAHANMPVTQGMLLKTGSDGNVEVQFEDGSVARATPDSSLRFDQLQRNGEGRTETQITALSGLSYYEFNNRDGRYSVHFGPYTASASKSSILRLGVDSNSAQLAVMRGAAHVETASREGLDLSSNKTATLNLQIGSGYDVAHGIQTNSWDQWNSERDGYLARLGAKATLARTLSNNPDNPAWSDLDYYGNWYNFPGYGAGWMPAGMGMNWDPFGSGYWGYYPTYGYTWISGYAWGWYPYHCGMWNWFDGTGWAWFPGNCGWGGYGYSWYPVNSIGNYPKNYIPPVRPKPIQPVRGGHMPSQQALIAVNRTEGTVTPPARPAGAAGPIMFGGRKLQPIEPAIHLRGAGPLGDSFRAASGYGFVRSNGTPGGVPDPHSTMLQPRYVPTPGSLRNGMGIASPAQDHSMPINGGGVRMSLPPSMSAPQASAPAPSGGGSAHH